MLNDPQKRHIYELNGEKGLQAAEFAGFRYNPPDVEDIFTEFCSDDGNGRV